MVRAARASAWRGLPRDARVVVVARSVNRLGAFSLAFLPALLTQSFSAGLQTSGLILSLFGVATVPSRLIGGQLADRWGRKRTMVGGLVGCAGAQLWIASAQSLATVTCAVALLGLVFELYEPPSQALLIDASPPAGRPAVFGLLAAGLAAAGMVSGLLAAAIAGIGLRWLFVADAVSCLACAVLVQAALSRRRCSPGSAPSAHAVRAWRDGRLLTMTTLGTVFAIIYLQIVFGLPLTLTQRHRPIGDLGVLLALSAATIVSGQALLRRGPIGRLPGFQAMALGYAVLAAGSAGMGFARSLPSFALCIVVWSIGDLLRARRLPGAGGRTRPLPRGVRRQLGCGGDGGSAHRHPAPPRWTTRALAVLRRRSSRACTCAALRSKAVCSIRRGCSRSSRSHPANDVSGCRQIRRGVVRDRVSPSPS